MVNIFGRTRSGYQLDKLISCRQRSEYSSARSPFHIVCDIDKTYLETKFESVFALVKIAFESPTDKITVAGAAEFLHMARWAGTTDPADRTPIGLHFVSSSPPQLRPTLEEKLILDGIDWNSDTFKNQAYNIRKVKWSLLREHIAYKSAAILNIVSELEHGSQLVLIGDNAESDAYIYTGIRLLLANKLSPEGYQKYLQCAGVERDYTKDVIAKYHAENQASVRAILIRKAPGYQFKPKEPITSFVRLFDDFFQAGLLLMRLGVIRSDKALPKLVRQFHNTYGMSRDRLASALKQLIEVEPDNSELATVAEELLDKIVSIGHVKEVRDLTLDLSNPRKDDLHSCDEETILLHAKNWAEELQEKV